MQAVFVDDQRIMVVHFPLEEVDGFRVGRTGVVIGCSGQGNRVIALDNQRGLFFYRRHPGEGSQKYKRQQRPNDP